MQKRLTAAGAETESAAWNVLLLWEKVSAVLPERERKNQRIAKVVAEFTNLEITKGKSGILLSSVSAAIWIIIEIPEKEAMAPAAAIAPKPPASLQEKIPPVTSKKPEKKAFAKGEERFEKNLPLKTISKTPHAITINAHILKQLSAAEIIDSTAQEALLFLGTGELYEEF